MTSNGFNDSTVAGPVISRWPAIDAIDLYVTPVWYVLGIPGNILAFAVWIQRRMRPSSGCYLAALALDECLFLMMQVSCTCLLLKYRGSTSATRAYVMPATPTRLRCRLAGGSLWAGCSLVPSSSSSIICHRSMAVTICGWEGNRRFGVEMTMRSGPQ